MAMRGAEVLDLLLTERGSAVLAIAPGDRSMEPTLVGGSSFVAAPLSGEPRPGDLLVFRQADYLVVHRYLGGARFRDGAPCLRTRGDGRSPFDPPLRRADVLARVVAVRRAGAWLSLEGTRARTFARLIAWHDLAWGAMAALARPVKLEGLVAMIDRAVLSLAVALGFRLAHGPAPDPEAAGRPLSV